MKKEVPDLIFLDIKLPDMSGMRILKDVRENNRKSPVIVITSFGMEELRREASEWDLLYFFNKPFEVEKIQRIAQEALLFSEDVLRRK